MRPKPKYVVRTFFITEEEAKAMREYHSDSFITHTGPHYELEDSAIMWCKYGCPAMGETFYGTVEKGTSNEIQ